MNPPKIIYPGCKSADRLPITTNSLRAYAKKIESGLISEEVLGIAGSFLLNERSGVGRLALRSYLEKECAGGYKDGRLPKTDASEMMATAKLVVSRSVGGGTLQVGESIPEHSRLVPWLLTISHELDRLLVNPPPGGRDALRRNCDELTMFMSQGTDRKWLNSLVPRVESLAILAVLLGYPSPAFLRIEGDKLYPLVGTIGPTPVTPDDDEIGLRLRLFDPDGGNGRDVTVFTPQGTVDPAVRTLIAEHLHKWEDSSPPEERTWPVRPLQPPKPKDSWLTVTQAAELLQKDQPGLSMSRARATVSEAAGKEKFRTNGRKGKHRRIESDNYDAWRLRRRDQALDKEDDEAA